MEQDIRYCTTRDGVRIAYCVTGDGPWLVSCPAFVESFSLDRLIDDQIGFWRGLWRGRRVVRYDMRAGRVSPSAMSDPRHTRPSRFDLDAVVRASGARDFTLWASTLSGPRAIDRAVRQPDEVRRLATAPSRGPGT